MNIRYMENKLKGRAGIYFIAPKEPTDSDDMTKIKIGRSIDIYKRMNSYGICFKRLYMVGFILLKRQSRNKATLISDLDRMEKLVLVAFKDDIMTTELRPIKSEWIRSSLNTVWEYIARWKLTRSDVVTIWKIPDRWWKRFDLEGEIIEARPQPEPVEDERTERQRDREARQRFPQGSLRLLFGRNG